MVERFHVIKLIDGLVRWTIKSFVLVVITVFKYKERSFFFTGVEIKKG